MNEMANNEIVLGHNENDLKFLGCTIHYVHVMKTLDYVTLNKLDGNDYSLDITC